MRTITGIPIKLIRTRIIIQDGRAVARYATGATGQGASQGECGAYADLINNAESDLLDAVETDSSADDGGAYDDLENAIDRALNRGCFVIYGVM